MSFLVNLARRGAGLAPVASPRAAGPVFEPPVGEEAGIDRASPDGIATSAALRVSEPVQGQAHSKPVVPGVTKPIPGAPAPQKRSESARAVRSGSESPPPPEPHRGGRMVPVVPDGTQINPDISDPGLTARADSDHPSGAELPSSPGRGEGGGRRGAGGDEGFLFVEARGSSMASVERPSRMDLAARPAPAPAGETAASVPASPPTDPRPAVLPAPTLPVPRTSDAAIPALPPEPRIEEPAPAAPRVEVRIGRVELKVDRPPAPPPPAPPRERPSFSDYAGARRGLRRGWY
jgi:hypothetical protein